MYIEAGRIREAAKLDPPGLLKILQSPEDQIRAKTVIAALAVARSDLGPAEQQYLEVLSFWNQPSRGGGDPVEVATILNNLGAIALWQKRSELALERLEQSLKIWQSIAGPASPNVIKCSANIAAVYMQEKRYDKAAEWLARATAAGTRTLGELHPFVVAMQSNYAEALKKAGHKKQGEQVARAAADARRMSRSPSTSGYTVDYRDLLKTQKTMRR
jgi:tetratricopeptide (TPR) repeat protein